VRISAQVAQVVEEAVLKAFDQFAEGFGRSIPAAPH
jgi:hypothetical protein